MILTCGFDNFDFTVVKWRLAAVYSNYVTDRLWKVESISFVIIFFIFYSGSLPVLSPWMGQSNPKFSNLWGDIWV